MANARGKSIDNTHLSIDTAEQRGFIHRDYIAHCHRWSHVIKWLQQSKRYADAVILDVGCGKDIPMGKMLYSSRLIPKLYIGLDYNKKLNLEPFHTGKFPIKAIGGVNFPDDISTSADNTQLADDVFMVNGHADQGTLPRPDVITSFEVIEHVEPGHARKMLEGIRDLMGPDSHFFLSTPCYDERVGAAGNHVNEMTHEALGALLEDLGFEIVGNYGTFASIRDYKAQLEADGHMPLFNQLRQYYDVNLLATIFAPLYPALARNNLWHLTLPTKDYQRNFKPLSEVATPWTSSDKWEELNG
jgi:hypothetical protein